MNCIKDAKRLFDPTLFWDAESVDIEQHADYIIARGLGSVKSFFESHLREFESALLTGLGTENG